MDWSQRPDRRFRWTKLASDNRLNLHWARTESAGTILLQTGNPFASTIVKMDDEAGGCMATEHLLSLGHERIGFLGVDDTRLFSIGRQKGWVDAIKAAGVEPREGWAAIGGNGFATGSQGLDELVKTFPSMTAVVVASVVSAIGVLAKARELGIAVPADLSVVAVHDIPLADYLSPPLTVVKMPLAELGREAV